MPQISLTTNRFFQPNYSLFTVYLLSTKLVYIGHRYDCRQNLLCHSTDYRRLQPRQYSLEESLEASSCQSTIRFANHHSPHRRSRHGSVGASLSCDMLEKSPPLLYLPTMMSLYLLRARLSASSFARDRCGRSKSRTSGYNLGD